MRAYRFQRAARGETFTGLTCGRLAQRRLSEVSCSPRSLDAGRLKLRSTKQYQPRFSHLRCTSGSVLAATLPTSACPRCGITFVIPTSSRVGSTSQDRGTKASIRFGHAVSSDSAKEGQARYCIFRVQFSFFIMLKNSAYWRRPNTAELVELSIRG